MAVPGSADACPTGVEIDDGPRSSLARFFGIGAQIASTPQLSEILEQDEEWPLTIPLVCELLEATAPNLVAELRNLTERFKLQISTSSPADFMLWYHAHGPPTTISLVAPRTAARQDTKKKLTSAFAFGKKK
jgi:hypothetical protein